MSGRDEQPHRDRRRVMEVLNMAYAGGVVDKRAASSAIREYEALLKELHSRPSQDLMLLPRKEVDGMKQVILYQEEKIHNLEDRRVPNPVYDRPRQDSGVYHGRTIPADTGGSDRVRRMRLADEFHSLYENEWSRAFRELREGMRWSDADCIYILMRVIRKICDVCIDIAEDQMDKLVVDMEHCIIDPLDRHPGHFRQKTDGKTNPSGIKVAEQCAKDYRRERAEASVPAILHVFMNSTLGDIIKPSQVRADFRRYIERCVELIWLMTTLDPPMRLYWQHQSGRVNTELFRFYDRKGDSVDQTVFPAVFLHNTGKLMYKGYVLAL